MGRALRPGEEVAWNSLQAVTHGRVVKKVTRKAKIKGHTVTVSDDNPEYIVESDESGQPAAHKRRAFKKS
jgi:hypothetical protein